ncbi:pilus assembly protein [Aphanothece sacrum]|uniref:Pilus biosynthesis protein n=1 Tax=Aphanothece sacrum FPU1 TaxID=1920663 RepID=A0A401ICV0_APHSA|nr:pilus assembly protein [Aphanothece sacrum]GBF79107.1 pilus biosynthesis protein [Aphanothece sacrum FPU1]GBF85154.1 pilus biosynthesis protein [Aphanothece sacrum FPU3]
MTFSEELTSQEEQDFEGEGGGYPTAFGITFTPQITAIALALLGLAGSIYVFTSFVQPALESYNTLKTDEAEKQSQVDQRKSGKLEQKMVDAETKLRDSEALRSQVLALFSNESTLATLLLDIDRFVKGNNGQLNSFKPDGTITIVSDGSLGPSVNNRLKRQRFQLEIEANFPETQAILTDLERLQPLLLVQSLKTQLVEEKFKIKLLNVKQTGEEIQAQGQAVPQGKDTVKTTFALDAILPLSPEELVKLTAPSPSASPGETPPAEAPKK